VLSSSLSLPYQITAEITTKIGIQSQSALLFKSNEIDFDNIVYLLEQHHAEQRQQLMTSCMHPEVAIDASLLGYKYLGTSLHPFDGVYLI
jgi:hypothetical protein